MKNEEQEAAKVVDTNCPQCNGGENKPYVTESGIAMRACFRCRFGEPRTEEDVNQIELVSDECAHFARTAIASAVKSERDEIEELRKEVERLTEQNRLLVEAMTELRDKLKSGWPVEFYTIAQAALAAIEGGEK